MRENQNDFFVFKLKPENGSTSTIVKYSTVLVFSSTDFFGLN